MMIEILYMKVIVAVIIYTVVAIIYVVRKDIDYSDLATIIVFGPLMALFLLPAIVYYIYWILLIWP